MVKAQYEMAENKTWIIYHNIKCIQFGNFYKTVWYLMLGHGSALMNKIIEIKLVAFP